MTARSDLSPHEIEELFSEFARTRGKDTRNRLVEAHMGLALYLARRFVNRGVDDEDLRQVALLALVKAVDRFDPTHGAAFSTFAGRTIEGEIKRHFRDKTWAVRVPRPAKELHLAVRNGIDELSQSLGRSPSPAEVAEFLEVEVDDVIDALATSGARTPRSIDGRPGDDDGAPATDAVIGTDDVGYAHTENQLVVTELLEHLPEREREIVRLRFVESLTQSDIASRMGISQMHVSRLLRRAIAMLQDAAELDET